MNRNPPEMRSPSFHPGTTSPGRDRKPLETESGNDPSMEFFKIDGCDRHPVVRGHIL